MAEWAQPGPLLDQQRAPAGSLRAPVLPAARPQRSRGAGDRGSTRRRHRAGGRARLFRASPVSIEACSGQSTASECTAWLGRWSVRDEASQWQARVSSTQEEACLNSVGEHIVYSVATEQFIALCDWDTNSSAKGRVERAGTGSFVFIASTFTRADILL